VHELADFDYVLPPEAIAQNPAEPRDSARMLVLDGDRMKHQHFCDLPNLLNAGDLLVLNNTKVTALRLFGTRATGGSVEVLLLRPCGDSCYEALAKPAKRIRIGSELIFDEQLRATVIAEGEGGTRTLQFASTDDFSERLSAIGKTPLPPYITNTNAPASRYQTIYAHAPGSSAAPTAGLHLTNNVVKGLTKKGIDIAYVTLDVGIDTFRQIQDDNHKMHGERFVIPKETVDAVRITQGRVIAVGTTSVRALESSSIAPRMLRAGEGCSSLFIKPGYEFKTADAMITNFHMPRTTMLFMVAALCGKEQLMNAYKTALEERYRFLSFGDTMLVFGRQKEN
jgi:S-adenosylmethionine:tRNA ribosyltransferase-isomerase